MKIVAIATATALSLVAPTFAQQQSGTGGDAAGERGSAAQTDRGASPANPTPPPATEASPGSGSMNTGGSAAPLAQDKAGKGQSPGASSSPRN